MVIVNTTNLEDYIEVIQWALNNLCIWRNGDTNVNEHYWKNNYRWSTCVIIDEDDITYCDIEYANENLHSDIVTMEQFYEYICENNIGARFGLI